MKLFLIFSAVLLTGFGVSQLLAGMTGLPSRKSKRAMSHAQRSLREKPLKERLDPYFMKAAAPIAKRLPLSQYQEYQLQTMLSSVDLPYTPREFLARILLLFSLIAVCAVPFFFLNGLIGAVMLALAALIAGKEYAQIYDISRKRKDIIEREMPRFAQHIALALPNTSNVTGILEAYRPMAGKTFRKELEKTIADIKTSNVQSALKRLSNRVGAPSLSEIIRGLCSVDNGIDQGTHFQLLAFTYRDKQNQLIKKEELKKPDKIMTLSLLGLFGLLLQICVILGTELIESLSVFDI